MNLSLNQLLSTLEHLEDQGLDGTLDMKEFLGDIRGKVDNTYEFITRLESGISRVEDQVKKLTARKRQLENAISRVKDYLLYTLDEHETKEIYGDNWDLKLKTIKSVTVTGEPDKEMFEKLGKNFINAKYTFNKIEIKKAYKLNPKNKNLSDICTEGKTKSVKFSAHKG